MAMDELGPRASAHRAGGLVRRILGPAFQTAKQTLHLHEPDFHTGNEQLQRSHERFCIEFEVLTHLDLEALQDDLRGQLRSQSGHEFIGDVRDIHGVGITERREQSRRAGCHPTP